jgi:hypothetical protein
VNRRELKIINFEHELHSGLELEISNNEIGVRKRVLLAMSCSINVDDFGSCWNSLTRGQLSSNRGRMGNNLMPINTGY